MGFQNRGRFIEIFFETEVL